MMKTEIIILIIANVIVSIKGFDDLAFLNKYKFQVGKIQAGEKIRMFSSGFLHADWTHLGVNMFTFYFFGGVVASRYSLMNFMLIYFGSLMAGSLYSLIQYKNEYYYSAVGASGAVSGIVFSSILLYPGMELIMFPIQIPIPGYIYGVGYLLYSIYGMKNRLGNIGHAAHLGGAIGGYVITILLSPGVYRNNSTLVLVMGGIIAGLLFFGDKLDQK